jgi:ribonuclease Z
MHEIIPVIKNSFVTRLKARKAYEINSKRVPHILETQRKAPRAFPLPRGRTISLNRVFEGPPVRAHLPSRKGYYIAFEDKKENSVSSVGKVHRISTPPKLGEKMKCWLQFLSTPTADTPGTTLLLHFDGKRYLIGNVGEGTQRATVQRKLGLMKVGDIFLTGTVGWGNAGGILGMILTLADASATARESAKANLEVAKKKGKADVETEVQKSWLNIHGGKNLTHLLATARRFVFRKGMPIYTNEFRSEKRETRQNLDPTFQDENVKVWAMAIEPEGCHSSPRKRSHNEFSSEIPPVSSNVNQETREDEADRNDQMRRSVVSSMFDSEWKLDALIKKKLSEVKMPSAIFMKDGNGKIVRYFGPMVGEKEDVPDIDVLVRNPWPGAMIEALPRTSPSISSVSYIIKNHPQRGKFNPMEAARLGVKKGRDFGLLTQGESVTAQDGSTVTPEMVLSQGKEGGGFAIVELPNSSYVEPLVEREEWSSKEVMNGIGAAIWILGPGVVKDTRLRKFMQDHSELKHIVSSKDCCSNYLALESPAAAAIRLHLVDSERFPIPKYTNVVATKQAEDISSRPYEIARLGTTVQLEPSIEVQDDKVIQYLDTTTVIKQASQEVLELSAAARKEVTSPEYLAKLEESQKDIPSQDAEIITLGTGSALPSKYRNVSATLLQVPGYGSYLFDCGENTLGQLKRVFGEELPVVLHDLKAIWISHLHADHHLGTAAVIKAWNEETRNTDSTKSNKLVVVSDEGMVNWLNEYTDVEIYGYERVEPIVLGRGADWKFDHQFEPEQTQAVGLSSIQACQVEHCHGALAVVFNFPNGFKVAYSGDCRPSTQFAEIGQDATLLIHEATFDDELHGDAVAKKHCTTSEALNVGKRMNARRILLTHFSQRYQKIPVMSNEDGKDQIAIVAFDYMRVKVGDIAKLEAFKPALMKLYEGKED